jgi:hypothetical protein
MWSSDREQKNPIKGRRKMFKKVFLVFVLAAALLAFAGLQVPTASACVIYGSDSCGLHESGPHASATSASQILSGSVIPATGVELPNYNLPAPDLEGKAWAQDSDR